MGYVSASASKLLMDVEVCENSRDFDLPSPIDRNIRQL